jgi:hypothetical protein
MITSGSPRSTERSADTNVTPAAAFVCIWYVPGSSYSTGSSIVITVRSGRAISSSAAYSVVDFPEPVGPVTISAPTARVTMRSSSICIQLASPRSVSDGATDVFWSSRTTTPSPETVGRIVILASIVRPLVVRIEKRPSCGRRCSARSSFAITFSLAMTLAVTSGGRVDISCTTPSMR